jgi:hypothetical protein
MVKSKPDQKFTGDDNGEQLSGETASTVHLALMHADTVMDYFDEAAVRQSEQARAIEWPPASRRESVSAEHTEKLIAALIVAEKSLNTNGDYADQLEEIQKALRATGRRLIEQGSYQRNWLPLDIWVVAQDDTEYWTLPDEWKDKVERVEEVCFFDMNQITHICSTSGNYYMRHLENRAILKDEFADDETLREIVFDYIQSNGDSENGYMDEVTIDRLIEANAPGTVYHYGNPGFSLDDALEGAKSAWHSSLYNLRSQKKRSTASHILDKLVEKRFSDIEDAEELTIDHIMEAVREGLQANCVL